MVLGFMKSQIGSEIAGAGKIDARVNKGISDVAE